MSTPFLHAYETVSYMPDRDRIGYFLLAADYDGRWYWGETMGDMPASLTPGQFHGPYLHKGDAMIAGEDWVAAMRRADG